MRQRRRSDRRTLGLLLIPVLAAAIPPLAASQASHSTQARHIPLAWFEDVTHKAGIVSRHHTRRFNNPYAEIMQGYTRLGAAAAVADYDRDGFEDIFVTDSCATCKNHLYHNNGDFTFTDVAVKAGVTDGNDEENASADALWFDYNNDGLPDLLVVRFGHSILYQNMENGTFRDVTKAAGLDRYMNGIKAIAFDDDNDGFVDLLIGCYFQPVNIFHPSTPRFFPESFENANNGGGVVIFHNNKNGTFSEVTQQSGIRTTGWTLDLGHGDANNDGYEDLYVANDFGTDRFYLNNGNGTFTDKTESAMGFDTKKGMNAEWGDFDNDGLLDIFVTNITDDYMREGNFLWHNNGNLTFTDVARETGTYDTGWGWAGKFFDYDNDGWLDLYVVNGWVSGGKQSYVPDIFAMIIKPGVDFADVRNWPPIGNKSLSGHQKKRLFHNENGHLFKDDAARHGLDSTRDGRGVAVADFDNDGRLDLFVTNADDEPYLYRNTLPTGAHWMGFLLEGTKSNRSAIGAQVRLTANGKTYLRYVNGGNGFASQSTTRVHFGLSEAKTIDGVEVRWPSGLKQTLPALPVDHWYKLVEGQPTTNLHFWEPKPKLMMTHKFNCHLFTVLIAACLLPAPLRASDADYQAGLKAMAANDTETALHNLELAVEGDPDNLQYANEYRQLVIHSKEYDRSLKFFEKVTVEHPTSANLYLNYGFAYVDKIPIAGSITQVILANNALTQFSKSIELQPSWIAYYTRGASYLFWPKIFNRAAFGVADLEKALDLQKTGPQRSYYVRTYISLGDGYWKTDDLKKARAVWREGLKTFPNNAQLKKRLSLRGEALQHAIEAGFDPDVRVNTDLKELWVQN